MNIAYSPRFDCFVYSDLEDPLEIAAACPQARELPGGEVIVPNDHGLLQKLAKRGVPVGLPLASYDWPHSPSIKGPLNAQRAMANFAVLNPGCFILSEMRTGKTFSLLWAADFVLRKEGGSCLIVGQLSTLQRVWGDAIAEHFMGRRSYVVLTGDADRRRRLLDRRSDFYIINYEGLNIGAGKRKAKLELGGLSEEIARRNDIQVVIVDEASAYRNSKSLRNKIARLILSPRKYLWMATGTPTPTAPTDAYGLARVLNGMDGESFTSFKHRTMIQISTFKWVPRPTAKQTVADTLTPSIRFTQKDCFDAPQCVTIRRDCELSVDQGKLWREMKRELTLTIKGKDVDAVNEAALRSKLIQIACGAVYDEDHNAHYIDCAPRMKVLEELIEEAPRKVLIFAPLTSVLKSISLCLTRLNRDHVLIDGGVTGDERDKRLRAFMGEDGPGACVAHPGPIARGLDFTAAATIIWFAPTDNTEDYIQANERINGPKQKHLMTIAQIAATPVEREIYRRVESNTSLQGAILKLLEE